MTRQLRRGIYNAGDPGDDLIDMHTVRAVRSTDSARSPARAPIFECDCARGRGTVDPNSLRAITTLAKVTSRSSEDAA
jgi:hypothetical protein